MQEVREQYYIKVSSQVSRVGIKRCHVVFHFVEFELFIKSHLNRWLEPVLHESLRELNQLIQILPNWNGLNS